MGWRRWEIRTELLSDNMKAGNPDGRVLIVLYYDAEMGDDGVE
jgi:hypothetical protein